MKYTFAIDKECNESWETTAKQFVDYSIYQTMAYQTLRSQETRGALNRLQVYDSDGLLVCASLIRVLKLPVVGTRIGYFQRGPLVIRKDKGFVCSEEMFRQMADYLFSRGFAGLRLSFNVFSSADGRLKEMLEKSGYCLNNDIKPYRTMMLSLLPEEPELLKGFHRGWRRNIAKAEKAGVVVTQDFAVDKFSVLAALYEQSKARKGFSGIDDDVFCNTQKTLSDGEKMLVTSVYVNDEPGTVLVTGVVGAAADDILVATSEVGYRNATAYCAYWNAFTACRKMGIVRYDLGGIDPEKNPTGFDFKSGTGAEDVTAVGTYEVFKGGLSQMLLRGAELARGYLKRFKGK